MEIIFDESKSRQIMVRVSEADYEFINELAEEKGLAQSTITRGLIEASLRELKKEPAKSKSPTPHKEGSK